MARGCLKIILDECFGPSAAGAIIGFLQAYTPPVEAGYLPSIRSETDRLDVDWTRGAASNWIVVSVESGNAKQKKSHILGPPLHLILPAREITGIFMTGKLSQEYPPEKARAAIWAMPEILEQARRAKRGTRFKIRRNNQGFEFSEWPPSNKDKRAIGELRQEISEGKL